MLRFGQSIPGLSRGLLITRNGASRLRSGQQQLGITLGAQGNNEDGTYTAAADCRRTGGRNSCHSSSSSSRSSSSSSNSRSSSSSSRGLIAASALRPSALFAAELSRRCMSTSGAAGKGAAATGDFAASQAAGPEAAAHSAAAAAAGDVGGQGAAASAADAAMAAAEAADTAQAVIEAAPATFKMALYTPPHLAMCAVDAVHAGTGMPYWMTIVAITLAMRTAILPVAVVSSRNAARSAAMKPEMDLLQAAIEADQQSSQQRRAERYRQETKALFKKYECSLLMNAALPVVQLPLFIGFFLGLRRMPEVVPEFATGGALWFQDLGAADPYMVFPITTGVMILALAEIGGDGMSLASTSTKMRAGMRAMALLIVPFTMNISTGVFVYWTTSNLYSMLQTLAMKTPSVRKRFNFPDPPKKAPASTTEKELNWIDVLGGEKPLQLYKKMKEQREVQAWFVAEAGPLDAQGVGAGAGGAGSVVREGAPLPPPPSMAPSRGKAKPVVTSARAEPLQQQVALYSVRPKPAGSTNNGKGKRRGAGDRGVKRAKG